MHTDSLSNGGDSSHTSERREHSRQAPNSLAYVHLDETNGGILINMSEGGLAVQAAMSVIEDELPRIRLQVPRSKSWLEVSARIVWTKDSRRMIGVQFLDLADDSRKDLRDWLAGENAADKHHSSVGSPMGPPPSEEGFADSYEPHAESRIERTSLPRIPAQRSREREREADLAAILAAREAVTMAARSARKTAAAPVRAQADTVPAYAAKERRPASSAGRYVWLVVALSVLSLAGGWEVGRGSVSHFLAGFFAPSAVAPVSAAGSLASGANANSVSTNFEIVDASNQSWLVPFAGPTSVPQDKPLAVIPPRPAQPEARTAPAPKPVFKVAGLSAPKSGTRSASGAAATAPVVQMDSTSTSAIPSALGDGTSRINLTRPTVTPQAPSSLVPAQLIRHPAPAYPNDALLQKVQGAVKVHATIEADGGLSNVTAVSGSPMLTPAAIEAVKKWKYRPETLDGKAVSSDIDITVQFNLPQ